MLSKSISENLGTYQIFNNYEIFKKKNVVFVFLIKCCQHLNLKSNFITVEEYIMKNRFC